MGVGNGRDLKPVGPETRRTTSHELKRPEGSRVKTVTPSFRHPWVQESRSDPLRPLGPRSVVSETGVLRTC